LFTGIVEGTARLARLEPRGAAVVVELEAGALAHGVAVGDSVALDGCCLTVTHVEGDRLRFEAVPETLRLTSLGARRAGDRLNVERALRADARLGGHIVQGHVDGTGTVRSVEHAGEDVRMRIDCRAEVARLLVPKGSVAIDGVSLTVVAPDDAGFSVALIPHTLAATTLGGRRPGDTVNLETDVLGKYVVSYLDRLGLSARPRE
jgi:riboflavin synthase alpha subunit